MPVVPALSARAGRSGALLAIAAAAAVLALMLPWSSSADGGYVPGWFVPGSCVTVYDYDGWPSMECTTGTISPGFYVAGVGAAGGKDTAVRVVIAAVVALVVLARRRRSARLGTVAVLAAVAGLTLGGLLPRPGQLAYLAGVALLAAALHRDGLLGRLPGARPGAGRGGQPAAGSTSPMT